MGKLEIAGKGTLFAVAISAITGGSQLISSDFYAGIALLLVGIALIIIWAFLIDWEAKREAVKAAEKAFEKFKLEKEGLQR
jgi:hydrogenase-4 membrane subunit HyfE